MTKPILIAVVGHTNAGKTSLLRTLTHRRDFGEVSDRPGTTRHVETIELKINGRSAVRFFDTPGLEDSVTLADYLKSLENCITPPDRVRAFLKGPEARGSFEQEAKVLRTMLEIDAAIYVIDAREAVLPKFRAEIEILTSCAKPIMPVLNFVRHKDSRKDEWRATLAAYGLHAYVQFDAVAPFVGSEKKLYQDLLTLLQDYRAQLAEVIDDIELQFQERRRAGCRVIAELLLDMAALRREIPKEEFDLPERRTSHVAELRAMALDAMRRGIADMLEVYGFRKEDADEAVLPWLEGRWEADLFNPETLKEAGKRLGAGAAVGAAIGLTADIASAGLSLGTGSVIGAAIGGIASQGWGPFSRKLVNQARGVQEVTLENEVLLVTAEHMIKLLGVLEQRGHAAMGKVMIQGEISEDMSKEMRALIHAVQPARGHPEWAAQDSRRRSGSSQRERLTREVMSKADQLIAMQVPQER
jgi:GTPase Era involved in 16S rRNA processing